MNMVMTFVLHLLSHYNSITEPRAQFLLFLLKHLTINFPSYFILSIINVHLDSMSRDKLIFPSAITRHHGVAAAHGCSPRYILYGVVLGEHSCWSYCTTIGIHGWFCS